MWKQAEAKNVNRGELMLTHSDYENIGQIKEALSKDAEKVWDRIKIDAKKKQLARRLFLLLCDVSSGRQITRRRPQVSEVMSVTGATANEVEEVVHEFQTGDRNFLLPDESLTPDKYLDVSHEALLRQWLRFSQWLEEERAAVAELLRVVDAARLYRDGHGALYQRRDLDRVSQWEKSAVPSPEWAQRYVTSDEWSKAKKFIKKSVMKNYEQAAGNLLEEYIKAGTVTFVKSHIASTGALCSFWRNWRR
jgi:hypothetical protein